MGRVLRPPVSKNLLAVTVKRSAVDSPALKGHAVPGGPGTAPLWTRGDNCEAVLGPHGPEA